MFEKFDFGKSVNVVATSVESAEKMAENAVKASGNEGLEVTQTVWDGPVPKNSFFGVAPGVRMSTPEFFLFRKVITEDEETALKYASEMFSRVRTSLTCSDVPEGSYRMEDGTQTTMLAMCDYLSDVAGHPYADFCFWFLAMTELGGDVERYESEVRKGMRELVRTSAE